MRASKSHGSRRVRFVSGAPFAVSMLWLIGAFAIGCADFGGDFTPRGDAAGSNSSIGSTQQGLDAASSSIRLISLNMAAAWGGRAYDGAAPSAPWTQLHRDVALPDLTAFLASQMRNPTVDWNFVALQETDIHTARSGGVNQPWTVAQGLTDAAGAPYYHAFIPSMAYQGGLFGNASIGPPEVGAYLLWWYASPAPGSGQEQRSALAAALPVYTVGNVWVVNTHLQRETAVSQFDELLGFIATRIPADAVVVVVGDLNINKAAPAPTAYESIRTAFTAAGFVELTFPGLTAASFDPTEAIDYALVRDPLDKVTATSIQVVTPFGPSTTYPAGVDYYTDHNALVIDLQFDPAYSCVGSCGGYAGACWCDSLCWFYGDCCDDKVDVCG